MSSNGILDEQKLDALFPAPSLPPSPWCPQRLPGSNGKSLAALQHVLKSNHKRHHVFMNYIRFHNHITHRALALYALGGDASIIKDYYEQDAKNQRAAFDSPEAITEENFVEHVGDENYYQAYVAFFTKQIDEKGAAKTLEEYIFSEKYNFQKRRAAESQPEMLFRLVDGLLHPMIHVGYGLEFGIKGMLAEGLAMSTGHHVSARGFHPPTLFTPAEVDSVEEATSSLSSLSLNTQLRLSTHSKTSGVHVFDILARMLKDDEFKTTPPKTLADTFPRTLSAYASKISKYAEEWTIDLSQPGEIERKMEEVIWMSSLMYAVGGFDKVKGFQANFFLMHMVTSSLFLPSLIAYLSSRSQVILLRAYLTTVLVWWVAVGRPALDVKSFMTAAPTPRTLASTKSNGTTPSPMEIPNPFLPIIQSAIIHPNDHVSKIHRAFAHFDTLYGTKPAGYFKGTELEGAEFLDGSLFLRGAVLTADALGWDKESQESKAFSFEGFYTV
ncbi:hypothetical protein F5I97DRAFT_1908239 [Phlebopus sp. FC_14]|nr:hypothetical protein F5I97DRAFT_1908239 [Phlebopus sp. FC_14]